MLTIERMSPGFVKHHFPADVLPGAVLHHFTEPDEGDPHDHPWSFTTHILRGGYVEEVYHLDARGGWCVTVHERLPGGVHRVSATQIHRIVALPHGECWTLALPGPKERDSRFWRLNADGIAVSRHWSEAWPDQ